MRLLMRISYCFQCENIDVGNIYYFVVIHNNLTQNLDKSPMIPEFQQSLFFVTFSLD